MKLYRSRIPTIAHAIIDTLTREGLIEVASDGRSEAELDLVAIMEEYLRRDSDLRDSVREHMADHSVPYDEYGRTRNKVAESMGHPTGDDVQRFLARQMTENFMISRWIEEVFGEDKDIYKRMYAILEAHDVDERALRDEAQEKIRNIPEGTVDYEIALSKALRDVKKRHGLIQ
jgi:hypothetical protein